MMIPQIYHIYPRSVIFCNSASSTVLPPATLWLNFNAWPYWRGLLLAALEILLERMVCIWKAFLDEQLLEWSPAGVLGGHVARRLNQLNSCRVGPLRRPERATASQPALRRAGSSPPLQHGGRPACCTTRACWGSWAWPGRPAARRGGVQEVAVREEERPRRARQEVSERKASPDFSLFTLDRQNCCIWPRW